MYLIHFDLLAIFFAGIDYTFEFNNLQMITWYIGLVLIVGGLAFVAHLSFEAPFANLEALVIKIKD